MKHTITKHKLTASLFFLFSIVACGGELPIQDMNQAKTEIGRAESLRAGEYAPEELEEAKKSLFQAHDKASEEKGSDAKKLANYATSKAYDALEKTLPKLAAKSRDEATVAIDSADDAYATGLASVPFDRAVALRKDGDQFMERGDQSLSEFLLEKDETKKSDLRQSAFAFYETSYNKYVESKKLAEEARNVALSSKSELKQSARYVEEDLNTAETYLGGPSEKTRKERESLASAYQDIDNNELKKANEKIQTSRTNARTLLANSIQNYARERLQTATEVVEDGNARFEKIPESALEITPEYKKNYVSARENLGAANESLASSGNLYSQEKFEDSIKQSEEAIRLANITLEQTEMMTPEAIRKRELALEEAELAKKKAEKKSGDGNLAEGWSKYKVQKTQPEDCLWRIAERKEFYGNAKLWPRIYRANKSKIKNKNLIYPNQVLYIPPKTGPIGSPYKAKTEAQVEAPKQERLNLKEETPAEEDSKQDSVEDESGNKTSVNVEESVNGPKTQGNEEELLEEKPSDSEDEEMEMDGEESDSEEAE